MPDCIPLSNAKQFKLRSPHTAVVGMALNSIVLTLSFTAAVSGEMCSAAIIHLYTVLF